MICDAPLDFIRVLLLQIKSFMLDLFYGPHMAARFKLGLPFDSRGFPNGDNNSLTGDSPCPGILEATDDWCDGIRNISRRLVTLIDINKCLI